MDKKDHFIRLNTGHEYCVEIFKDYMSVLCLKKKLNAITGILSLDIEYKGYLNKNTIISKDMNEVPDCLVKVPDSVGCHIKYLHVENYLPKLIDANYSFIKHVIQKTTQLPAMRNAHSDGMISYLFDFLGRKISKPIYALSEEEYAIKEFDEEKKAKCLSDLKLQEKASNCIRETRTIKVTSIRHYRNPYIVEYTKRKANGICYDCNTPAPFVIRGTGEPYLEIHHIIPLASGGEDSIENTIALCPNCHRKRHHG